MAVDGIIANGVTEILKKLSSVVANEITLVWDFNDELKNLQTTLSMILAVMEDAEKKQVSDGFVRLWIEKLKYIAYDAEEILDDYSYEIIGRRTQTGKVRKPSQFFRWRMAHKIKEINEKFNKIAKRKNDLGLQTIDVVGSSSSHNTMMMMNRETYSLVVADWKIVGRENDKSKIINTVLDKDSCLVLSIVGLGGMGKTTMAQLVYNDEVVQKDFQIKIWICVSDPFDVKKLFKNIANSIEMGKKYDDVATMDDIAHRLQEAFRGKKFLLVLDDVWNENPEDWYKFKTPFMVGAEGSKILVTTRSVKVASIMVDKLPPYPLGILNDDDSWSLFKELAFGSGVGAVESLKLVKIGKTMVKRCGGLPIAVIFLGSLMRSKKTEEEWKNIRDTKIWHESHEGIKSKHKILPSLRLSYDNLPSNLKQCFSYCCLFPKDWRIEKEKLIRLWMAEGFLIESSGENAMSMEEIGNEYFHNLLSNFFFQDVRRSEDGDIIACKMHDLAHDLASSVVGKNECLIVENAHDIDCISEATLRLNLINVDEDMLPKVLEASKNAKNLRTVFVRYKSTSFDIGKAFNKNKRLRVLDLDGSEIINLPSSGLKYLRYLPLPPRRFIIIPKGIGHLRFLQSLEMFRLDGASGIEELEGLNHLRGELNIDGLGYVPNGKAACRANLKEKKNLRGLNLSWGDVRYNNASAKNHEAVLEGLRPHPNLRTLWIEGFQGAKLPRWIMEDSSSCLPNLVHLTLNVGDYIEQVAGFGALPSLRSLRLNGMKKLECIGSSFPLLKNLSLSFLDSWKEWVVPVPLPLPQASTTTTGATTTNNYCFPLLEEIYIGACPALSTITPTTVIFPSLKVLNLQCIDGSAAVETLVTNNLNSLTSLTLWKIPNLISLPRQGLMENNNTLLSLQIEHCPEFEGFFPPPNNDDDDDDDDDDQGGGGGGGQQLQEVSSSNSSSLQSLKLYDCPALRFYPNIFRSLTSLRSLDIQECKISESLHDELTCLSSSLEHLEYVKIWRKKTEEEQDRRTRQKKKKKKNKTEIKYCRQLTTTAIFSSLKVLDFVGIDGRAVETLVTNNLNSLTSLTLWKISNLITLPRQGLMENNNTLLSLEIKDCPEFEGFFPSYKDEEEEGHEVGEGGGGQQQLQQVVSSSSSCSSSSSSSSLQTLKLYHCPALRLIPNIHSLTSLRELVIIGCKKFLSLQGDLTCFFSSLKHLEHVKILKFETATEKEEVFEWRKSSSFKE